MNSTTNPVIAAVADASGEMLALEPQSQHTSGMTVASIRRLIADDSHACTFQSFGQYRTALLKAIDRPMPQSPSSSSSSEAERDYPPLPEAEDFMYQHEDTGITGFIDAQQVEWGFFKNNPRLQKVRGVYTEAQMRAYVDADRAARATPPSLPIDFKQASEQGGWRSMETAPKDGEVLLFTEEWGRVVAFLNDNWDGDPFWDAGFDTPLLKPTCWMPLHPRPEEGALLLGGDEGGKKGGLIATAPELLAAIESEYAWLADIQHNWAGRDTAAGQQRLCRLRDLICKATGRDPQDVQDDYSNRSAGTQP